MNCPKCGTKNPDDAQLCSSCGHILKNNAKGKLVEKPKVSRLAIISFILSLFSAFLFLIAAVPSIMLAILSIHKINKSEGKLKGKSFSIAAIVISILLMLTFFLWSLDAPPIPDDYTIADLRSAPTECNSSYELLLSLSDKDPNIPGAPAIGLSEQDYNSVKEIHKIMSDKNFSEISDILKANADRINHIWEKAREGKDIINKLDTFEEIADLSKPNFFLYDEPGSINLLKLSQLYYIHACLQVEKGNIQDAVNELNKIDSVLRKLSINARDFLPRFLCLGNLNLDMTVANFIANSPHTSQESLQCLAEHFRPLTDEQTALRNSIIFQYLIIKNLWKTQFYKPNMWKNLFLKRNSTLRLHRNFFDKQLDIVGEPKKLDKYLSVWPELYSDWLPDSVGSNVRTVPLCYQLYNITGSIIFRVATPSFEKRYERKTEIKVKDDLLQIVLNKRLGKEINLKARAYSDEYIVDLENKKLFSPGPDGKPHTKDDIKLLINPEVLKWDN